MAIDDELEEKGTDERGRLVIPMEPGTYDVRVTKPGYVTDSREIEVKVSPTYQQEEGFILKKVLVSLKVKTVPPVAKVSLDGGGEAESDADGLLTFMQVDPSVQHSLHASKENYSEETVTVQPYKMEQVIRLTRDLLTLTVKTDPAQTDVYLDDAPAGTSDAEGVLKIDKVKTGREHSLRASKEGYVTQSMTVPPGYELAVIKLPPAPGTQNTESRAGPPQKSVREGASVSALEVELKFWDSIKDRDDPDELVAYIKKYPDGQFIALARIRLDAVLAKKKAGPEPADAATPTPAPAAVRESADASALEEAVGRLRKDFGAGFTYRYTEARPSSGGVTTLQDGSVDVEPVRFEGCSLEWRVAEDLHMVSLSELDPTGLKVELHTSPGITYLKDIWRVVLQGTGGKEVFEKFAGGRGGAAKNYWRLILLYDNKEKADRLAETLRRAIELCGGKP